MECDPDDVATVLRMVIEVIEDRAPEEVAALERLAVAVDEARGTIAPIGLGRPPLFDNDGRSIAAHALANW